MRRAGRGAALLLALLGSAACSEGASDEAEATPRLLWSQAWGTDGDDFARSVAVDSDGNAFLTGYSNGALPDTTNAGAWDAFLARFDAEGGLVWAGQWGSPGPEFAQGVVLADSGRLFVAGYTPDAIDDNATFGGHDAFVTSYGADGERGATAQWGTAADDYVYAAASSADGVVVAGYTKGAFEGAENAGVADAFLALCDENGAPSWTRQWGTEGTDYAQAAHVDSDGNILVTGYTDGQLGDDPDLGAEDAFLIKLDAEGELLWLRQWGSDATDYALAVTSDAAGNLYVTGYTYGAMDDALSAGGEDGYLTKLSPEGELVWTRQFGTPQRDSARSVTCDEQGRVLVGGDTEGALTDAAAAGLRDSFVARFDAAGELDEVVQWGSAASEFVLSVSAWGQVVYAAGYAETGDNARDAALAKWRWR